MPRLAAMLAALGAALVPATGLRQAAAGPRQGPDPESELARAALHRAGEIPAGLDAGEWSSLRAAYDASRHAAQAVPDGYLAHNPGQRWSTRFGARGASTAPDAGGWSWGLELLRYGFAGDEVVVRAPLALSAAGQRVRYAWDATLEEWYVNDERGLEHGFTVRERPAWSGGGEPSALSFTLAVRGGLAPRVQPNGRDVSFVDAHGASVLGYAGLVVLDADGRSLAAGFERVAEGLLLSIDERGARYPLTIDPVAQQAYLKASNTGVGDGFGFSVALSGDTAVIGALNEDSSATGVNGDQSDNGAPESGAAYVLVRSGTGWSQQAYLKASNTGAGDHFGQSVAISGDTLVIGAAQEDGSSTGVDGDQTSNGATNSGAAYVFVRSGTSWTQQAYLKASNTGGFDAFGVSVSVSGDTLVIGALAEDSSAAGVNGDQTNDNAPDSGAAYVFVRSGTSWSQEAYLKASNTGSGDQLGFSAALSGDTVVVGAPYEDSNATGVNGEQASNSFSEAGAAYVFVRSGTTWSQEAYLKASNTQFSDAFGWSVSTAADTLVVGAFGEDSSAVGVNGQPRGSYINGSGAAYVFVRDGTIWSQQAYLKASNTGTFDAFGTSVSIDGQRLLVGARYEASASTGVDGEQTSNGAFFAGAAYLFERSGTTWTQEAYLKPTNTTSGDNFGISVAVSGFFAIVGAWQEDSNATGANGDPFNEAAPDSGALHAFSLRLASVVFRNAGANPASYVASPATIGSTFTATVDNALAGQTTSLLFAFDTATSFPLASGQTLLCFDFGSGELLTGGNLFPASSAGGVDSYALPIPNNPGLVDLVAHSQALQLGNPPFVLSNAQDLVIGAF